MQGDAIVTDTIPVLKPLKFINSISFKARARSLLNIYKFFLMQAGNCRLQFPLAIYPPAHMIPLTDSTCLNLPQKLGPGASGKQMQKSSESASIWMGNKSLAVYWGDEL